MIGPPPDVTCNRCGEIGLFWQSMYVDGQEKPVLFEEAKYGTRRHECNRARDTSDHFD